MTGENLDLIIHSGEIVDGQNTPRYRADIGIYGDRIAAIGDLTDVAAAGRLDASGMIVAPGFIDVHTHSDGWLPKERNFVPKTTQGFATEFLFLDGMSYAPVDASTVRDWIFYLRSLNGLQMADYTGWKGIGDYMTLIDGRTAQNAAAFVPYANVRTLACGFGQRFPDDHHAYDIKRLIQRGMEDGALGLSTGLDYADQCYASTEELVSACEGIAPGGVYVTHVRYALGTLSGVKEAVEIGRRAGVPVHISHLKAAALEESEAILAYIDHVAVNEVDFSFDVYPYLPSSTMLQYLLPHEVWSGGPIAATQKLTSRRVRASLERTLEDTPLEDVTIAWVCSKANARHQGASLATYIAASGRSAADAICDLLIEEGMAVLVVFHLGNNDAVTPFLAHPCCMLGSDGIFFPDGLIHPRVFGSAPRVLGRFAREQRAFSLELAVHKMSGFPAKRFGLDRRGVVLEGHFADLVVFDPLRVSDRATFDAPRQLSVGVQFLLVNGRLVIDDGLPADHFAGPAPGRYLRK